MQLYYDWLDNAPLTSIGSAHAIDSRECQEEDLPKRGPLGFQFPDPKPYRITEVFPNDGRKDHHHAGEHSGA